MLDFLTSMEKQVLCDAIENQLFEVIDRANKKIMSNLMNVDSRSPAGRETSVLGVG